MPNAARRFRAARTRQALGKAAAAASGPDGSKKGLRLQRVLADAGVASRRACEEMIEAGRVFVNGRKVNQLPVFVDPRRDKILVDGRPIRGAGSVAAALRGVPGASKRGMGSARAAGRGGAAGGGMGGVVRKLYIMLHKPARTVTTASDEHGRRTVLDLVNHPAVSKAPGDGGARLFPVGRLDFDTTGMLLLTNDGDLAHRLTHARYAVPKVYHVEVKGNPDDPTMAAVEKEAQKADRRAARREQPAGPEREEAKGARVQIRVLPMTTGAPKNDGVRTGERGRVLEVTMAEGKNREVGAVLRRAGFTVKRVACVGLGPVRLRGLAVGEWRELDRTEIRGLRRAAGLGDSGVPKRPAAAPSSPPTKTATVRAPARQGPEGTP